jgi:DNA polymerase I-like protein with 3'-5' exonuclease and polymerase domains
MHDATIFSIVIKNPFTRLPIIFASIDGESMLVNDLRHILQYKKIVSFGFEDLIDMVRTEDLSINSTIVDISTMKRLCIGKPKGDYNKNLPWDLLSLIGRYVNKPTIIWMKKLIELELINPQKDIKYQENLSNLMEGFIRCFYDIEEQLKKSEEYNRFYDIEVNLYNVFLDTQKNGIKVDQLLLEKRLITLKNMYYSSLKILELDYGFNSENINFNMQWEDISSYCDLNDFESDFNYDFWSTVKLLYDGNDFLKHLLTAYESFRDYNELLKYQLDKYSFIYPIFDIVGTVTSRIQIKSPGIQFIKKGNRDIFIPREEMSFIYADFSQFEPGILASFSEDRKFLDLYNKADVYEELSKLLFNDVSHRRVCKTIFLSFIYGMKKDNIFKLITRITDSEIAKEGIKFFDHFNQIQEWKNNRISEAENVGYSKSYFGNYRYLKEKKKSSSKEKRWIPNQIIQGTASYILKMGLCELYKNVSESNVNFLIPMHDAILLEIPTSEIDAIKDKVNKIFSECFKNVCPNIIPRISFDEFSQ